MKNKCASFNLFNKKILGKLPLMEENNFFVPQGICSIDDNIIISCYDSTKKSNSLLYIFDKTGKYKKIFLDCKVHAGGICYHKETDSLFVTGSGSKNTSFIHKYCGKSILKAIDNSMVLMTGKYCVDDDGSLYSSSARRSSPAYICCFENKVFLGNFTNFFDIKKSIIKEFAILKDGSLGKCLKKIKNPYNNTQGLCLVKKDDEILYLFSRSSGTKKKSLINVAKSVTNKLININSIIMPSMLEQINVYNDNLLVIFESAAYIYRKKAISVNDEIFLLDLNKILNYHDNLINFHF